MSEPKPTWATRRLPYRHRTGECTRLLFEGYLPPGTSIRIRCPACGLLHPIDVPLNGTGINLNSTGVDIVY